MQIRLIQFNLGVVNASATASYPGLATQGDFITITTSVQNTGTDPARPLLWVRTPAGTRLVESSPEIHPVEAHLLDVGELNGGEIQSVTLVFEILPEAVANLSFGLEVAAIGTDTNPTNDTATVDVAIDPATLTSLTASGPRRLPEGADAKVTAHARYDKGPAREVDAVWSSSNEAAVESFSAPFVRAATGAAGAVATIQAAHAGATATFEIEVTPAGSDEVVVRCKEAELPVGYATSCDAERVLPDGSSIPSTELGTWSCDAAVAECSDAADEKGTVECVQQGETDVQLQLGADTTSWRITCVPNQVTRLEVSPPVALVIPGSTIELEFTAVTDAGASYRVLLPERPDCDVAQGFVRSCRDASNDRCHQYEYVSLSGAGENTCTASDGVAFTALATILAQATDPNAMSEIVPDRSVVIAVGGTGFLGHYRSQRVGGGGYWVQSGVGDWSSADENIARVVIDDDTIARTMYFEGVSPGTTFISGTVWENNDYDGPAGLGRSHTEIIAVTVRDDLIALEVEPSGPVQLVARTSTRLRAYAVFQNGERIEVTRDAIWIGDGTALGNDEVVDAINGTLLTYRPGNRTVRVRYAGIESYVEVTVTAPTLTGLFVSGDPGVKKGTRARWFVGGAFDDATAQDLTADAACGVDAASAEVLACSQGPFEPGLVYGLEVGSANLEFRFAGQLISQSVTVHDGALGSLFLSGLPTRQVGERFDHFVIAQFDDGGNTYFQDLTADVTFSSSDPDVLRVGNLPLDERGRALAKAPGIATITATWRDANGVDHTAQTTVEVIP